MSEQLVNGVDRLWLPYGVSCFIHIKSSFDVVVYYFFHDASCSYEN